MSTIGLWHLYMRNIPSNGLLIGRGYLVLTQFTALMMACEKIDASVVRSHWSSSSKLAIRYPSYLSIIESHFLLPTMRLVRRLY